MVETAAPKLALVTGGASGIGLALGRAMARRNIRVVLADTDVAELERVAAEPSRGMPMETVRLDVTDADAVRGVVEELSGRPGGLDYLFNNAGIGAARDVRDATLAEWRRVVEINLMGVVHGVASAYPIMARRGGGHIVNTASIAGLVPWPGQTLYNTTKYAVVGLSHTLRTEAARFGVRVSVICPGPVRSAIWGTPIFGQRVPGAPAPPEAVGAEELAEFTWRAVQRNRATIVFPRASARQHLLWRLHPALLREPFALQLRRLLPDRS